MNVDAVEFSILSEEEIRKYSVCEPIECTVYFDRKARQTAAGCRKVAGKRQESGRKAPRSRNAAF